jgi:hypothetical protein
LVSEGFWNICIPAVKVEDSEYAVSFGKGIRPAQLNNGKLYTVGACVDGVGVGVGVLVGVILIVGVLVGVILIVGVLVGVILIVGVLVGVILIVGVTLGVTSIVGIVDAIGAVPPPALELLNARVDS